MYETYYAHNHWLIGSDWLRVVVRVSSSTAINTSSVRLESRTTQK